MTDPTIFAKGVPQLIGPDEDLLIDNSANPAHVFTFTSRARGPSKNTVPARTILKVPGRRYSQVQLEDVTTDLIEIAWDTSTDEGGTSAILGTNDGGTTFFAIAIDGQGRLHTVTEDSSTVTYPQIYLGGVPAPASGIWLFVARVNVAATALTVNNGGGALKMLPLGRTEASLEAAENSTYEYPVTKGTTYTVAAGAVTDGQIVPS